MTDDIDEIAQLKQSIMACIVGSCSCNTKSPNVVYHLAHCRYAKLMFALDCLERLKADRDAILIELERSRDLRAKLELSSMRQMDELRVRAEAAEALCRTIRSQVEASEARAGAAERQLAEYKKRFGDLVNKS